jgi:crotonobetainyl-CoA:carnitine CoA-transferase CaiB-like acyl-CoA transferase
MAAFGGRAGVSDRSTPAGEPPVMLAMGIGDMVTGMTTVSAILAALLHRERTGRGQLVATSLLRSGAYCIGSELATRLSLGKLSPPQRRTSAQNPLLNSYQASDQKWFWLIGAEADRHWPRLVAAIDDPRLASEEFATARGRRRAAEPLIAILDDIFCRRSRDDWARRFEEHDVWWAPVNSAEDVLTDRQAQAAGVFVDIPTAEPAGGGIVTSIATPADFETTTGPFAGPPPTGSDTIAVLSELGLDSSEVRRLHDEGIVHSPEPLSTARS